MKTKLFSARAAGQSVLVAGAFLALLSPPKALSQISYSGGSYFQDFNTLDNIGAATDLTWINNGTLPGWYLFRQPAPGTDISTYRSDDGGSTTGSFYSYGTDGNSDRALGGLGSGGTYYDSPAGGAVAGWFAVSFTNVTGQSFTGFNLSYTGEQWRNGGNTTAQTMVLEYGLGDSFQTVATWSAAGAGFNFTSPTVGSTASPLDGNNATNRVTGLGGTVSLTWDPNTTLWLRWIENNDAGNDHGLAIDDFNFTAIPEPGTVLLLGLGAGLIGWSLRRSNARGQSLTNQTEK